MPRRAHAVEDNACDLHVWAPMCESIRHYRRRLRLARDIENQYHWQAERCGDIRRRALPIGRTVEQAHCAFDDEQRAILHACARLQNARFHRPCIEVD